MNLIILRFYSWHGILYFLKFLEKPKNLGKIPVSKFLLNLLIELCLNHLLGSDPASPSWPTSLAGRRLRRSV
jgi:hypothetical protein